MRGPHHHPADRSTPAPHAKVRLRISAPPIFRPCFYGIDAAIKTKLIASTTASRSTRSRRRLASATCRCGASWPGLDLPYDRFCFACSTAPTQNHALRRSRAQVRARGRRRRREQVEGAERISAYAASSIDVEQAARRRLHAVVDRLRGAFADRRRTDGFGSGFTIPPGTRRPVIISSTDGVGTKPRSPLPSGRTDTISIDLVAITMTSACTARTVASWSCVAIRNSTPSTYVAGVDHRGLPPSRAHPGGGNHGAPRPHRAQQFDLAATTPVGERSRLLNSRRHQAGDYIMGLTSYSLHANGFSLVRRIVADQRLAYDQPSSRLACRHRAARCRRCSSWTRT